MDESVAVRYFKIEKLANEVLDRFYQEIDRLGFTASEIDLKQPSEAKYRLEKDPFSSEYTLVGDWLNEQGMKLGSLLFHADGSFFVEQDIVRPHPSKSDCFVEAINAWGKHNEIRAEARLLSQPE